MSPRTVPLFPLPLVLFPGVKLPLHIFEPRYRRMLADCLAGDRTFGIVHLAKGQDEEAIAAGTVGCLATIETAEPLPDGRSNIVVEGGEPFALLRLAPSDAPYHVAEVEPLDDDVEPADALAGLAADVRGAFARVAAAARALQDDRAPVPELPADPALVAYRVASMIDLDADARQRLLATRSPLGRLREIRSVLERAAPSLERRAAVHERAKSNGRGPATDA